MVLSISVSGQNMLIIHKPGKVKKIIILHKTVISFQLHNDHRKFKKEILSFEDSSIVFDNFKIPVKEISMLKIPLNPWLNKNSVILMTAGVVLFAADQLNNSVINDNDPSLNDGVTIVSGSLVLTGFLLRLVQKRKYKFPGKRKLILI